MRRRMTIEMGTCASPDNLIQDLFDVLVKHADCNTGFSLRQEILPEKNSGELQIPVFKKGGILDGKADN